MAKKRKRLKKKYLHHTSRSGKRSERNVQLQLLEKEILTHIFTANDAVPVPNIHTACSLKNVTKKDIQETVDDLVRRGYLVSAGKKRFTIDPKGNIYSGKIEKNPRGFGFVIDLQPEDKARFLTKDPFLTVANMGSANHGDQVLIAINRIRRDGRPESEIISILTRCSERITGFFQPGKPPRVIPEDPRYPAKIQITENLPEDISQNDAVIVEILPLPAKQGFIQGKIEEVLGSPENIDVQMRLVIENYNLSHVFPNEVLAQAEQLSIDPQDFNSRIDLRQIPHITIDGEDAKDFDDAIAVEKQKDGYRLYVSIADVSHFVKKGSPLDKEAYSRGTSVYFPGRVIPMLPEKLSNNLCSLVPDQDRLTFSAILDFDKKGKLIAKEFAKTVIRSRQRFTYTTVKHILIDNQSDTRAKFEAFLPMLEWANELAKLLYHRRLDRGSIGFNIPEADITLHADGTIQSIQRKERNFSHQIIEEFMLAANEAVAEVFTVRHLDSLYRIHDIPDNEKVEEFIKFAQTLGLELPEPTAEPGWFAAVLDIVRGSPTEYVVNNLLLRTMQQARYDAENRGHFGLAASDYTHFTSPIRRYPDLIVHRHLHNHLQQQKSTPQPNQQESLKELGQFLSARERTAINAERNMADRLKIFFMIPFIGDTFPAIISGVTETAIYLELINLFVSGVIEVTGLKDDYYLFDIKRFRLIGEISGRAFPIGGQLNVTLIDVDHRRKRIYFTPTDE